MSPGRAAWSFRGSRRAGYRFRTGRYHARLLAAVLLRSCPPAHTARWLTWRRLGVIIAVLVGMIFLVIAEALVPSGSMPGRSTCCAGCGGG